MDESGSSSDSAGNACFFIFNTRHKHLLYIFPFCDALRSQEPIIIGFGLDYQRPLLDGFADQNH